MAKALLVALLAATLVNSPLAAQEFVEGEIMFSLRKELPNRVRRLSSGRFASGLSSLDKILARHRTQGFERFSGFTAYGRRLYRMKVPATVNIDSVLQNLRNNPNVEHAERIELLRTTLTPNDTEWANQWNFDASHLQAEDAWDIETGANNVILAIIDTGLDHHHPDLTQNIWRGTDTPIGLDFCGPPPAPTVLNPNPDGCTHVYSTKPTDTDPQHEGGGSHSHGTKMAGVAAAKINNMRNVAGLAGGTTASDGVRIMGLRAGYDRASGTGGSMRRDLYTDAIDCVVAHQSRTDLSYVVNMSFASAGTTTPSPNLIVQAAVTNAWNTGRIVLVAGARGANNDIRAYPAAYDNVIGVTGVTQDDVKGTDTGYGSYVDVAAPVEGVPTVRYDASTGNHEPHLTGGTTPSISAAQVSGLAALVWSKYPELTNAGVVHQIVSTADDISAANAGQVWSGQIGSGRINAYRALTEWSGPLLVQAGETLTWSGTITITDHVTIPAGITLELEANTEVRFQARNVNRLQLVVHGTLNASASGITFRSTNDDPANAEWYGILVPTGGSANLSGASLQDGTRCVSNTGGTVTLSTSPSFTNCGMMPSQPRNLVATLDEDENSVALSWDAPADNGGVVISSYQYNTGEGTPDNPTDSWTTITDEHGTALPTVSSVTIDDLTGTEYTFWVRAVNAAGVEGAYASRGAIFDRPGSVSLDPPTGKTLATLTVGDQLTATLSDANGVSGTPSWHWERGTLSGDTWTGSTIADETTTTYELATADVGFQVRATASYTDGHGSGKSAESDPTVVVPDRAPTITAASADPPRVEENKQEVGAYMVDDPDGHTVTWQALTGTDHEAFELTGMATDATRTLQFKDTALPNFEVKTSYTVTLQVSSQPEGGGVVQTAALDVTVNITNVKEPPGKPVVTIAVPATNGHTTLAVGWTVANTGPPATYNLLWCVSADCQNSQTLLRYLTGTDTTLTGLRPATEYAVGVQAVNAEGNGPWNDDNTATTAAAPNRAPVLAGPADTTGVENTTSVAAYTATDADGDTLTWSLAGADADAFALVGMDTTRTLQFQAAPNYEQPADAEMNNVYRVDVIATDTGTPPLADTLTVAVTVDDVDEPGEVTVLPATPQVDVLMTGTLYDPDGGSEANGIPTELACWSVQQGRLL